eukprot:3621846-Rhodomonas_salina.2
MCAQQGRARPALGVKGLVWKRVQRSTVLVTSCSAPMILALTLEHAAEEHWAMKRIAARLGRVQLVPTCESINSRNGLEHASTTAGNAESHCRKCAACVVCCGTFIACAEESCALEARAAMRPR